MHIFATLLLLLSALLSTSSAIPSPSPADPVHPLAPRQSAASGNGNGNDAAAFAKIFSDLLSSLASFTGGSTSGAVANSPVPGVIYTPVPYSACAGTSVSGVLIGPCEGSGAAQGNCVFAVGRNYSIVITYTSPSTIAAPRSGLASYDGDQRSAYSGQSFGGCTYTACPVQAGVAANYTYTFRTLRAPQFQRLVFNATNGVQGESFMCASIPVGFSSG